MNSIKVIAHAKVNLLLKVLNRRNDGYHNILTVFERISLADEITISKSPDGITVSSDNPITSDPKDNLVYKAASLIMRRSRIKTGVDIRIKKRIPIAGGMGGGSSDAASTLTGINRLFGLGLPVKELIRLGSKLGADVPFFVMNTPFAIGRSKGEKLVKIKAGQRLWHLVLFADFGTSAAEIYRAFDKNAGILAPRHGQYANKGLARDYGLDDLSSALTSHCADGKIQSLSGYSENFDMIESMMSNDLGAVVISKYKSIGNIIERLAVSSGKKAIVSGSGPSVFCLCRDRKEAIKTKDDFYRHLALSQCKGWRAVVASTA